jgi:hypothetical protein
MLKTFLKLCGFYNKYARQPKMTNGLLGHALTSQASLVTMGSGSIFFEGLGPKRQDKSLF